MSRVAFWKNFLSSSFKHVWITSHLRARIISGQIYWASCSPCRWRAHCACMESQAGPTSWSTTTSMMRQMLPQARQASRRSDVSEASRSPNIIIIIIIKKRRASDERTYAGQCRIIGECNPCRVSVVAHRHGIDDPVDPTFWKKKKFFQKKFFFIRSVARRFYRTKRSFCVFDLKSSFATERTLDVRFAFSHDFAPVEGIYPIYGDGTKVGRVIRNAFAHSQVISSRAQFDNFARLYPIIAQFDGLLRFDEKGQEKDKRKIFVNITVTNGVVDVLLVEKQAPFKWLCKHLNAVSQCLKAPTDFVVADVAG